MSTEYSVQISVLTPVYNVEAYLDQCLDSLARQTFQDFEVICINDGSTDNSRAILAGYQASDSRFRLIDQANTGYGAAMNRGLAAARGRYIAILESDDWAEPTMLAALFSAAQTFTAEVVRANCWLYWTQPRERNVFNPLVPAGQSDQLIDPQQDRRIMEMPPAIWSGLYSRDFLEREDIRFLETPGASYQDTAWAFKVWAAARRAVFLREALVHYRQDNQNSSVNAPGKVFCVMDEYQEMQRWLTARAARLAEPIDPQLLSVKARMKLHTYFWNYDRLAPQWQSEFLERMVAELQADQQSGSLDEQWLEPWSQRELRLLLQKPQKFIELRQLYQHGRWGRMLYYWRLGGPGLLVQVLRARRGNLPRSAR